MLTVTSATRKRNFGNFIAVAFLFGLAGLTIFCAIGNCAPKGTKFVRNQYRNNPAPSNGFCTLSPQKFQRWDQPTMRTPACTGPIVPGGGSCPSITVPYPVTPAQVATLPAAENGEAVEVRLDMPQTGLACEAQAICKTANGFLSQLSIIHQHKSQAAVKWSPESASI